MGLEKVCWLGWEASSLGREQVALPRTPGSKVQTFGCSHSEHMHECGVGAGEGGAEGEARGLAVLGTPGAGGSWAQVLTHSPPVKKRSEALKVTVSCLAALPGVCPALVSHPHALYLPFFSILQLGAVEGLQAVWRVRGRSSGLFPFPVGFEQDSSNVVNGSSVYVLFTVAISLWLGTQVASIISNVVSST